jgi:hypothetical protein
MQDPGVKPDVPASAGPVNGAPPPEPVDALELRVRRLEDVVATLQDTRQLEERVAERLGQRLASPNLQLSTPTREPATVVVETGRRLLPAALDLVRPKPGPRPGPAAATAPDLRTPWLLFEFSSELRGMWLMIVDPRYRLSWTARIVLFAVVPFIVTSAFWPPISFVPFVGWILDKALDIVLAFFAYKVLARELAVYRQVTADLPVRYRSAV